MKLKIICEGCFFRMQLLFAIVFLTGDSLAYSQEVGKPTEGFTVKVANVETANLAELLFKHGKDYHAKGNHQEAFTKLQQSSQYGHADAIASISFMYYRGEGVGKDYVKSFEHAKVAALHRSALGASMLGICYAYGNGVRKDPLIAYFWLSVGRHFDNNDEFRESLSRMIVRCERLITPFDLQIANVQIDRWIKGEIEDQNIVEERTKKLTELSATVLERS